MNLEVHPTFLFVCPHCRAVLKVLRSPEDPKYWKEIAELREKQAQKLAVQIHEINARLQELILREIP